MSQLFVVTAMYSSGERSSIGPVLRGKLSGTSLACLYRQRYVCRRLCNIISENLASSYVHKETATFYFLRLICSAENLFHLFQHDQTVFARANQEQNSNL